MDATPIFKSKVLNKLNLGSVSHFLGYTWSLKATGTDTFDSSNSHSLFNQVGIVKYDLHFPRSQGLFLGWILFFWLNKRNKINPKVLTGVRFGG